MKYYILKNAGKGNELDMFLAGDKIRFSLASDSLSIPREMESGSMIIGYQSAPADRFNSLYKLISFDNNTLYFEKEFEVNGGIDISSVRSEVRNLVDSDSSGIFEIDKTDYEFICKSILNMTSSDYIEKPYDGNYREDEKNVEFSKMTPSRRQQLFEEFLDSLDATNSTIRSYKKSMLCDEMNNVVNESTAGAVNNVYEIDNVDTIESCQDKLLPQNGKRIKGGFPLAAITWYIYFIDKLPNDSIIPTTNMLNSWEQVIYFGAPGSGKSHEIRKLIENERLKGFDDVEKEYHIIRTTFHPDYDYSGFVGCYKPHVELFINKSGDEENKIIYKFVPQAFTDVYVRAWKDVSHPYYLIIEEINRGNCAQIFGDLFQLLDRRKDGCSEYPIKADNDLKDYLEKELGEGNMGIKDGKLCLPPNLSIIASMNTSDQSLFPMDSAFKRRWAWEFVPIDYDNDESSTYTVTIGGSPIKWSKFLRNVNNKIKDVTDSEDKQMGNFFIKHSVNEKEFCDKVMFYIWSEVGKENYKTQTAIFKWRDSNDVDSEFTFNDLYPLSDESNNIIKGFIYFINNESRKEAEIQNDATQKDPEKDIE